jgi:hypothetical protein
MAVPTNAKRQQSARPSDEDQPADQQNQTSRGADRNGDGRIDLDDLLIGARETFHWVFSWRGAMLCCGAFTIMSAGVNIASWQSALRPLGSAALGVAFVTWGTLQVLELMPVLDDLSLKASIGALIRLQRKPIEVPNINQTLQPAAKMQLRKYRNRERNQALASEFFRYLCYGIELAVLVIGGGVLSPIGVSWAGVIMTIVGICGVELGLRKTSECGEKLMSPDERDFLKQIAKTVQRSAVTMPEK